MPDWTSPAQLQQDAVAYARIIHVMLGLYVWEMLISMDFDWECIFKRKIQWPMVAYLLGRYSLLFALIGIIVALDVQSKMNCQTLYTFNLCAGFMSIAMASVNLCMRTVAVWSQEKRIAFLLFAIIVGHWALLICSIRIKAKWIPGQGCVVTDNDNKLLAAVYIYTVAFDFLVLVLTSYKLSFPVTPGHSRLVHLIFRDGIIYFLISFMGNAVPLIFLLCNFNAVMSIIASVPASVAATIAASRVVRRLRRYNKPMALSLPTISSDNSLEFAARPIPHQSKVATTHPRHESIRIELDSSVGANSQTEFVTQGNESH